MRNNCLKFLTCFAILAFAGGSYADEGSRSLEDKLDAFEMKTCCQGKKERGCFCSKQARLRAEEINAAIDLTFPKLQPGQDGAAEFASFFAEDGVFVSPGGILSGKANIFAGFQDYANQPGEVDQHVVTHNTYWDGEKSTLTVERTWYATLTQDRCFCGTLLRAGTTYAMDDCVVIRFACEKDCKGCILPGKVVYYNEYFNECQTQSIFPICYPRPCKRIGDRR